MNLPGAEERWAAEQRTRVLADRQLSAADKGCLNLFTGVGVEAREALVPSHGRLDYLLYVDARAVGVDDEPESPALDGAEWRSAMRPGWLR